MDHYNTIQKMTEPEQINGGKNSPEGDYEIKRPNISKIAESQLELALQTSGSVDVPITLEVKFRDLQSVAVPLQLSVTYNQKNNQFSIEDNYTVEGEYTGPKNIDCANNDSPSLYEKLIQDIQDVEEMFNITVNRKNLLNDCYDSAAEVLTEYGNKYATTKLKQQKETAQAPKTKGAKRANLRCVK